MDDARDLREKAFFAPVRSHYKVYIIDEAHMVSTQGFNALLKLVEEPPDHLRFIFATTEPDKVIPTIRSRTHHYPFRLIPPRLLSSYLTDLCQQEAVQIDQAALPLVVRAGAGSARDTLSVLDQLIGGAGPDGVTHELAADLLGYTPDTLLDEVVDAFAAGDGAAVFGVVDKVIETGQDPRRFTEDLLRRLRDLVIVDAVPEATASGLIDVSEDQGERLVAQAARFGSADLSRAADIVATGLTEMRGATAPRLLLELILARVLLPGADNTTLGLVRPARPGGAAARHQRHSGTGRRRRVSPRSCPAPAPAPAPASAPVATAPEPESAPVAADPEPEPEPIPEVAPAAAAPSPAAPGSLSLVDVRRLWPDIVEATKVRRRMAWIHLSQNCQVVGLQGDTLTLGFANPGARDSFVSSGCPDIVREAAIDVVGSDWKIDTIVDPGAQPGTADAPVIIKSATEAPAEADPAPEAAAPAPEPTAARNAAREAIQDTRPAGAEVAKSEALKAADADADRDDLVIDEESLGSEDLLARELGAQMIEEIPHK